MEVVRVILEWDFDQDDKLFATEELARKWVEDTVLPEMAENMEDLEDEGLVRFESIKVIGE